MKEKNKYKKPLLFHMYDLIVTRAIFGFTGIFLKTLYDKVTLLFCGVLKKFNKRKK